MWIGESSIRYRAVDPEGFKGPVSHDRMALELYFCNKLPTAVLTCPFLGSGITGGHIDLLLFRPIRG